MQVCCRARGWLGRCCSVTTQGATVLRRDRVLHGPELCTFIHIASARVLPAFIFTIRLRKPAHSPLTRFLSVIRKEHARFLFLYCCSFAVLQKALVCSISDVEAQHSLRLSLSGNHTSSAPVSRRQHVSRSDWNECLARPATLVRNRFFFWSKGLVWSKKPVKLGLRWLLSFDDRKCSY